jgi:hypothetical protein
MGYYIRILGKNSDNISLQNLRDEVLPATLTVAQGPDDEWEQAILAHESGQEIALIEKNPVVDGQLGADELQEFIEEVAHYKPESAAKWLRQFLPTVEVIYAFQLLSGTDVNDGWTLLHRLYAAVWNQTGGILQADGEGFSDEDGFTILWQFADTVTGAWNMGSLQGAQWVHFEMDLGNKAQREAFTRGEIPPGVKIV